MILLLQLSLLIAVTAAIIIPWTSRGARVGPLLLLVSYAAHLLGALFLAKLQLAGMPGDAIGQYHPAAVAFAEDLRGFEEMVRGNAKWLFGAPAVELLGGAWYSAFGISFIGMFCVSATIGFVVSCLLAYDAAVIARSERQRRLMVGLALFLPSFLVWNGLFGKEPLAALGSALVLHSAVMIGRQRAAVSVMVLSFGLFSLGIVRPHMAAIAAMALAAAAVSSRRRTPMQTAIGLSIIALMLVAGIKLVSIYVGVESLSVDAFAERMAAQSQVMQRGGSASGIVVASPDIGSFLKTLPIAIAAMLTMPFPGSSAEPIQILVALETTFVFFLLLRYGPRAFRRAFREREIPVVYCWYHSLIFLFLMSVPLVPNIGLMVRQRTVLWIPLLLGVVAAYVAPEKRTVPVTEGRLLAARETL